MSINNISLENQFGEKSLNKVVGGDLPPASPINDGSLLANFSGSSAVPVGTTGQAVANKLPAKTGVAALVAIADPTIATAEDCANKINAIIAALKVVS